MAQTCNFIGANNYSRFITYMTHICVMTNKVKWVNEIGSVQSEILPPSQSLEKNSGNHFPVCTISWFPYDEIKIKKIKVSLCLHNAALTKGLWDDEDVDEDEDDTVNVFFWTQRLIRSEIPEEKLRNSWNKVTNGWMVSSDELKELINNPFCPDTETVLTCLDNTWLLSDPSCSFSNSSLFLDTSSAKHTVWCTTGDLDISHF